MRPIRSLVVLAHLPLLLWLGAPAEAAILRVDDDAAPGGDGASWPTAYRHLQDALAAARADDTISEIRLAGGVHRPDRSDGGLVPPGSRAASFELVDGVAVRGAFVGLDDLARADDREVGTRLTILSGDLLGDDGPDFTQRADNSLHVLLATGTGPGTILDGVVVEGGHADGATEADRDGGGARLAGAFVRVVDCTFRDSFAERSGGGLHVVGGAPRFLRIFVHRNRAALRGGGLGVSLSGGSVVMDSHFAENESPNGAALYSGGDGVSRNLLLTNVLVTRHRGYAIIDIASEENVYRNCTITQNEMGIFVQAGILTLANTILWGNHPTGTPPEEHHQILLGGLGQAELRFCAVEGLRPTNDFTGERNTSVSPAFVDSLGPDGLRATGDENFRLAPGSPAIDRGNNQDVDRDRLDLDADGDTLEALPFDLDGNPRRIDVPAVPDSGRGTPPLVDLGAYEAPAGATGIEPPPEPVRASFRVWPNPAFAPVAFALSLPREAVVEVVVFDARGRRQASPVSERLAAGEHAFSWRGEGAGGEPAAPGVYYLRFRALGLEIVRSVTLLR